MADNKKYYYLKLKEDFFDSPEIKVLESQPSGYKYCYLLLKLYLMSLRSGGRLRLNNLIPYDPDMIASITRMDIDTVKSALVKFQQIGLIERLDDGTIYMLEIQNFIGKSSTEADRKRHFRAEIESQKALIQGQMSDKTPTDDGQNSDKSTPEIELEIEKEKELDKENIGAKSKDSPPPEPPVIELILNDKSLFPITQSKINEWESLYPAVDVLQELRKMKGWLDVNPSKRKTQRGILRFANNWLAREQDRGRSGGYNAKSSSDDTWGGIPKL